MASEPAFAAATQCGRTVRALCGALVVVWAIVQALQGRTDAMIVNGTEMTMDQAIMAAAGSPKMFRLMEDANVVRVEMDMLFKTDVWESMMRARESTKRRQRRKATRHQQFRWSNAVVPYQVAVSWSDREYQQFQEALNDYHKYTCLRFHQATSTDDDYLRIVDGTGCSSYVGRQGGPQTLSLATGCRVKGIIIHELGHAVGFYHEQTRPDRDTYVVVMKENIQNDMVSNFEKYTTDEMNDVGVPYDYLSVMHYGEYAFSKNRQRTIRTVDPAYQSRIGNRGGFSFRDIKMINAIYECAARNRCGKKQCPEEGFVGPNCTCWCPSSDDSGQVTQCSGTTRVTQAPVTQPRTIGRRTQPPTLQPQQQSTTTDGRRRQSTTIGRPSTAYGAMTTTWHPCQDANDMCRVWAELGDCDTNPRYMLSHCSASCRSCDSGTVEAACDDVDVHCDRWRERGYCSSRLYAAHMQQHCPRTCGVCSAAGGGGSAAAATVRSTLRTTAATTATRTSTDTPKRGQAGVATTRSTVDQILKKIAVSLAGAIGGSATDAEGRRPSVGGGSGRVFIRVQTGGGTEQVDEGRELVHEGWLHQQQVDDLEKAVLQQIVQLKQEPRARSRAMSYRGDSSPSHELRDTLRDERHDERRDERRQEGKQHSAVQSRRGEKRNRG